MILSFQKRHLILRAEVRSVHLCSEYGSLSEDGRKLPFLLKTACLIRLIWIVFVLRVITLRPKASLLNFLFTTHLCKLISSLTHLANSYCFVYSRNHTVMNVEVVVVAVWKKL